MVTHIFKISDNTATNDVSQVRGFW